MIIFNYIYLAAAAEPPPPEPTYDALFAVGAQVQTDPDSTSGIHPSQAEVVYGVITMIESRGGSWWYQVRANNDGRNHPWVPETRVRPVSRSLFGGMLETRAFPIQQRYKVLQTKSAALRDKYNDLRLECPVLAGEISRLETLTIKLDERIAKLEEDNKVLADDLRESSCSSIFARSSLPVGRNATAICAKVGYIRCERDVAQGKIDHLQSPERLGGRSKVCATKARLRGG